MPKLSVRIPRYCRHKASGFLARLRNRKSFVIWDEPRLQVKCPGVAVLSTRFLCRTCVGISLRRELATPIFSQLV
jgi:hypothetical protein